LITRAQLELKTPPIVAKPEFLSERVITVLLFAATFLYLFAFRRVTNMDPDEGIVLQGAERILHGQVLYRDFFSFYTPASFYLTALTMKIFGDSLSVARTLLIFFGAVFPVTTYLLARRTCSRQVSLLVAALVAATSAPYRFLVLHNWDSTFWACLAVYCAVRWLESSRSVYAFATGTFTSLTFLSEQSKGAGLGFGIFLAVVILAWTGRKLSKLSALCLGFGWPILSTLVYFALQHALHPMLRDLLWPFEHYSAANRVRYGDQNWSDHARNLLFYSGPIGIRIVKAIAVSPGFVVPVLPIIAVALLFYWAVKLRREPAPRSAHYVMLCAILSGLLVSVMVVRADIIHFMYLAPLFYLVLAWILDPQVLPTRLLKPIRPYLAIYTVAAFALMGAALLFAAVGSQDRIETRRGVVFTREPDSVLQYALAHTVPGENILVLPYLPLYYYLSATQSPSPYEYFQPGMSTPQQANEIIESVKSSNVRTVFFEPAFADKIPHSWPGTPLAAIGHDPIGDYIARNYRPCAALRSAGGWDFLFMRRRDLGCQ